MMRRCILEFASSQSTRQIPRQITSQIPSLISARKELSVEPQQNAPKGSGSAGKPSESGTNFPKLVIGSVAIGAVVMAAYQTGYLNKLYTKEVPTSHESAKTDTGNKVFEDDKKLEERGVLSNNQDVNKLNSVLEHSDEKNEAPSGITEIRDRSYSGGEDKVEVQDGQEVKTSENSIPIREDLPSSPQSFMTSDDQHTHTETPSEGSLDVKDLETKSNMEQGTGVEKTPISSESRVFPEETKMNSVHSHHHTAEDVPEDAVGNGVEPPSSSLLDAYHLQEKADRSTEASLEDKDGYKHFSEEVLAGTVEKLNDASMIKDGKLVLDFLQAIHTAEKRQAELDAQGFAEEKRILKEKYEKELKDARARELMYAEEAAILDKELNKERVKAAAAIRSLQGKAAENLKLELERKEKEAELQLKKVQDLAKAELAAAIASEKASQIEKMAEANLHINALCMAFYARSEEARQSHSVHKLALGALALEDALSKGLPIQTEINALHTYLEGIDRDSFLDLVLSSLPEDTLYYGTDTQLQLNQRFNTLKGTLRHYSLIPPGGGGILAHTLAHIASSIKVQEDNQSGDGIESLISRVESFLAEGKLAEAADALEGGVRGSQAEEVAGDWVRRVRNRAITEQALTLLQSYATSISII